MLDGAILGAEDTTAPYSIVWNTTGVPNGPHTLTALARDPSTNATTSASVPVTVNNTGPPPGVVAAYGFDTGSGTARHRRLGQRQQRHADERDWAGATAGRFGNALSFNGTNASVQHPDSNSLDLTAGMTIEAWLNPNGARQHVAHGRAEGAARLLHLRHVREQQGPAHPSRAATA
jgi:hypothetical protein